MDVFERVREINWGAGLPEERITASRARLLTGIDEGRSAERKRIARRPMIVIAGAVAGAAAVTAGVVVVSQMTAPPPHVEAIPRDTVRPTPQISPVPQPTATSGTSVTEPFPGTTPRSGQYLRIVMTDERLMYRGSATSIYQWSYRPEGDQPAMAAVVRDRQELYVPGDRDGEWRSFYGPSSERIWAYPDDQDSHRLWDDVLPYRSEVYDSSYSGGFGDGAAPIRGSDGWYAQYPEDPGLLIQNLRDKFVSQGVDSERADELVVNEIIDELIANYAPARTRETFVEALELSGHAEKTVTNGGVATYRLHQADVGYPRTITISIDSATGWATEFTSRVDRGGASGDIAPGDLPDIRKTFAVSIVDDAP